MCRMEEDSRLPSVESAIIDTYCEGKKTIKVCT